MKKEYDLPDESKNSHKVGEPVMAHGKGAVLNPPVAEDMKNGEGYSMDEVLSRDNILPSYSLVELKERAKRALQEIKEGKVISQEEMRKRHPR